MTGEREKKSILFCGYRYTLRDRDTTGSAAYESVCRHMTGRGVIYRMLFKCDF